MQKHPSSAAVDLPDYSGGEGTQGEIRGLECSWEQVIRILEEHGFGRRPVIHVQLLDSKPEMTAALSG